MTGYGPDAGQALAEHMDVDKIAFTGSTAIGKLIAKAAMNMKRVSLELGGKSPSIICADADLELTVGAALADLLQFGQVCMAASRIYVHSAIYDRFMAGMAAVAESFPTGATPTPCSARWSRRSSRNGSCRSSKAARPRVPIWSPAAPPRATRAIM